jgi:hypothetical protein
MLAFARRMMDEASIVDQLRDRFRQLAALQCLEEVARERDPLALPACQAFLDRVVDPAVHDVAQLGAEPTVA